MNELRNIISFCLGIFLLSACITIEAHAGVIKEIRLDDLNTLVVRQEDEHNVCAEILYGARRSLVQRLTSGNGWIEPDDVRAVSLGSKETEYLVSIHVWGSNYGAMTGIIVYKLIWWKFFIIPDDKFSVKVVDGVLEIRCERLQEKTYQFVRGVLKEKAR